MKICWCPKSRSILKVVLFYFPFFRKKLTKYLAAACTPPDLRVLALLCYKRTFVYTDHWWAFSGIHFSYDRHLNFLSRLTARNPGVICKAFWLSGTFQRFLAHFHLASFLFLCLVLLFLPSAQFGKILTFCMFFYGALQLSLLAVASWYRSHALAVHALEPFLLKCFVSRDQDMLNPNFLWETIAGTLSR